MTKLTKQEVENEREAFEVWIKKFFPAPSNNHEPLSTYHDGIYDEWSTFLMFESWKDRAELAKEQLHSISLVKNAADMCAVRYGTTISELAKGGE